MNLRFDIAEAIGDDFPAQGRSGVENGGESWRLGEETYEKRFKICCRVVARPLSGFWIEGKHGRGVSGCEERGYGALDHE